MLLLFKAGRNNDNSHRHRRCGTMSSRPRLIQRLAFVAPVTTCVGTGRLQTSNLTSNVYIYNYIIYIAEICRDHAWNDVLNHLSFLLVLAQCRCSSQRISKKGFPLPAKFASPGDRPFPGVAPSN